MSTWSIYYSDRRVWTGLPENAPTRDVQVIVQPCEHTGWAMQNGADYYVWRMDLTQWCGTDSFGLWDYMAGDGWKKVLFGRMISGKEFNAIYKRAKVDRDEKKRGFQANERVPTEP